MQKIVFCGPEDRYRSDVNFNEVNDLLSRGWEVKSITPQVCSATGSGTAASGTPVYSGFAVLLEKSDISL